MRTFVIVVFVVACAPAVASPSKLPQGASLVVTADPSGWVRVREPNWFAVDFPKAPESVIVPERR